MNSAEATQICTILSHADGGCSDCASNLFREFLQAFPQFRAEARAVWVREFSAGSWFEEIRRPLATGVP